MAAISQSTTNVNDSRSSTQEVKQEDERSSVETDDVLVDPAIVVSPSFKGRLNMDTFAFTPSPQSTQRLLRSTSRATSSSAGASPAPSLKRKPSTNITTSSSTSTTSPHKRPRPSTTAAKPLPPSLPLLPDRLAPNLHVLFTGLNPGIQTSTSGHAYAHPSNHFWRLLASSKITPRPCRPSEDQDLPALFKLGFTNIVARPTRNGAELRKGEMEAGVEVLEEKVSACRPETVCVVGKGIWEVWWGVSFGMAKGIGGKKKGLPKLPKGFQYGWQDERVGKVVGEGGVVEWDGARVFVATSTSGLAGSVAHVEKERIWRELGSWVEERRKEDAES